MKTNKSPILLTLALIATILSSDAFADDPPAFNVQIVEGQANIVREGLTTTITASTPNIIAQGNLSTITGEMVRVILLSANNKALLRSDTGAITYANGSYFCNGNLFMVNTAGFVFGPTATVQAASVLVSTLNIDNSNFMNPAGGAYKFYKDVNSSFIYNAGRIAAQPGGYVALLSQAINNSGTIAVSSINANIGKIVLAVGEKMTVSLDDKSQISVAVDEKLQDTLSIIGPDGNVIDSAIKNSGTILAEGGKVVLTAKVLNKIFDYAVNNTGVIQATNLVNNNGVIELVADGPSPVLNAGTMEADYIKVSVKGAGFINATLAKIVADGAINKVNGGTVSIEALTIMQKGLISANAYEGGVAGDVSLISEDSTILDENSRTMASCPEAVVGTGGRIIISSKNGSTFVNRNALIDVSAGAITGDAGYIEVGAFDQLGFYGVLSGRAPPGHGPTIIFKNNSNQQPVIITDKSDYQPADKPVISGSGFLPYQNITINISSPDGSSTTLNVSTDAQGNFSLTYEPTSLMWGTYVVVGTDGVKSTATTFTDARALSSITVGSQTGSLTYGIASSVTYIVTFTSTGNGSLTVTNFSVTGLPSGATASFSPTSLVLNNGNPSRTTTLTINTTSTTPAGTPSFTVQCSYAGVTGSGTLTVNKATPTLSVANSPVTYNGSAQVAVVNGSVAGSVSNIKYNGSSTTPTDANTYTITANFVPTDTTNYNSLSGASAGNFIINKADATVTVTGYTGTYDAAAHGASGSATGVGGVDLSASLNLGSTFTDVPGGTANWTFNGGTNYNNQSGSASITINQKQLTVTGITANNKVYDGNTSATLNTAGASLSGVLAGDTCTLNTIAAVGTFDTPDIGAGKTVTVSGLALNGTDAGNYSLPTPQFTTTADITPVPPPPSTTNPGLQQSITDQSSSTISPRYPLPDLTQLTTFQTSTFNGQVGPIYYYQPLTPYDMAAFDAMILSAADYQFLNGTLSLTGHAGLMSMFEELNNRR